MDGLRKRMINLIKNEELEITSTKLDLLYQLDFHEYESGLVIGTGSKLKMSKPNYFEPLAQRWFKSTYNMKEMEQRFIDWAHNDIATELQGTIDDPDTILEIRIWNRRD